MADYDQVIALHPGLVSAYQNRGLTSVRKGDYDSAIKGGSERLIADYEKALSLDPSDAGASGRSGVRGQFLYRRVRSFAGPQR
ncbi:hypothetical protein EJ077_09205 [Mesorhizobium sp. M8A.F.Ca.ET.057.01.1.1]|uniref:tetratricopeptide repeat protein n=1 Tax=Mesorhizobium sp. M8A.F.Ca.ET.057.01.1.1 TaxID=2493679 RepID=UPI000F750571|nr:hypothetical protein EJ077_09205 [Mesorhizobium sp. M8A.F.Ca.ET.057.01.1.1]RWE46198.1 MAG: hypothetical protein EOS80_16255 [Mesorhizobium sp.]